MTREIPSHSLFIVHCPLFIDCKNLINFEKCAQVKPVALYYAAKPCALGEASPVSYELYANIYCLCFIPLAFHRISFIPLGAI
jgi:hypothetical protein